MELEKKSNLRSLVPAVLVGLLALAANEYTKMDPAVLRDSVESMEKQLAALMKEEDKPKPKKTDLGSLRKLQASTSRKYERWRATRKAIDAKKLRSIVEKADRLANDVLDDPETKPKQKSFARLLQVTIYFMASEWAPNEYSRTFIEMADATIESDTTKVRDDVAVLRFYHLTEFGDPNDRQLLADLAAFGERHGKEAAIELHSMVATELWRRGYRQLSVDVLEQGIRRLSGSPGISRLVNQLIDQRQL